MFKPLWILLIAQFLLSSACAEHYYDEPFTHYDESEEEMP